MKKFMVTTMTMVFLMAVVCGCQGGAAKGPSDTDLINKVVADWTAAAAAKNLDGLMAGYSETFQHYEWGNKDGLKSFLKDAISMGYLENAQVTTDKAKLTIEKGEAKYAPVELKAAFGSATIELTLKKEVKDWKITGMDVEQH